jgi:ABC-type transport system involved in multi-copper enzyme maturation permease subunit
LEGLQEIGVIWRGELGQSLKSGRIVVLLVLFLLFTGLTLLGIGWLSWQWNQKQQKAFEDEIANSPYKEDLDPAKVAEMRKKAADNNEGKKFIVNLLFSDDDAALGEALLAIPFVLLIVFKLSIIFLPLFIALMGFDQLSAEIGSRSIRYLVVRARRSSLVLGKFATQGTVLALLMLVCVVAMIVVSLIVDPDFTTGKAALTLLKLWVVSVVFSLAYLGLTTFCSALFRQPAVSLVLNVILLFVVWFIALIGDAYRLPGQSATSMSLASLKPESVVGYVRYVSVWHFSADLIHPHWQRFGAAGLAHLGFAMVFLGAAYLVLRARDV